MGSSYVKAKTLDLTSAHTNEEIPVGAQSFRVRTDSEVTVRFDSPGNPTRELKAGSVTRFCKKHPGESFDAIYVTNAAASGQLELEIEHDFIIEPEPGEDISDLPQPERLTGDLGAGETIADGEDAAEKVDTSDASSIRVRAKVSGISGQTQQSDNTVSDAFRLAADEDRAKLYVLRSTSLAADGTVVMEVLDASDPENLTSDGSDSSTTTGSRPIALGYDPDNNKVVGVYQQQSTGHVFVGVWDVSDPTAPSFDGETQWRSGWGSGAHLGNVDIDTDLGVALVSSHDGGATGDNAAMALVTHTGGGAPTIEQTSVGFNYATIIESGALVAVDQSTRDLRRINFTATNFSSVTAERDDRDWNIIANPIVVDATLGIVFARELNGNVWALDADTLLDLYEVTGTTNTNAATIDAPDQVLYTAVFGTGTRSTTYDRDSFTHQNTTAEDDSRDMVILLAADVVYSCDDDDVIWIISADPGSDVLLVRPLLTDGSVAATGQGDPVTLRGDVEALVDLELAGEDQVEIRVQARSGVQTTVDYVEQYRR